MTELLKIPRGITAIIGSGGKTTLMMALARQLPGRCIIATSTKIYAPEDLPIFDGSDLAAIDAALLEHRLVCVGANAPQGKLSAPYSPFEELYGICDHLLIEADGSRKLPLKAHEPHEPVIPQDTALTILVAGLSGLGRPICDCAHRPELFAALCGKAVNDIVTAEDVAAVIIKEGFGDIVLLNQLDAASLSEAQKIASLLPCPVFAGSLSLETIEKL